MDTLERYGELARHLARSRHAVAFTGAGISAPSGIATFRSEDGIWARFPVEEYGTRQAFQRNPERCWELFGTLEGELARAQPNAAHLALAELEHRGLLAGVITQNIDGLHQRAGSRRVVEYHGTASTAHCPGCRRRFARSEVPPWPPAPRCPGCGRVLRPDVVLFGDPIPAEAEIEARDLLSPAGLVLVVGSTLEVAPASWLVLAAADRGATVAVVDPRPSATARGVASLLLEEPAERALPGVVQALPSDLRRKDR